MTDRNPSFASAQRAYDNETPPEPRAIEEAIQEWIDDCPVTLYADSLLRARIAELVLEEHDRQRDEP
jgi:hypothetical protein